MPKNKKPHSRVLDANARVTYLLSLGELTHARSPSISRFYNRTAFTICRRVNRTLDCVSVKRRICKSCHACLNDGHVRVRGSRGRRRVVVRCQCGKVKRFLIGNGRKGKEVVEEGIEKERTMAAENARNDGNEENRRKACILQ